MSSKRFTMIALLGFILSFAFAGTASAEQCSEAMPTSQSKAEKPLTICLVTDTSQSLVPPFTLQFKVPSEVTRFTGTLDGPGPEGTNLWNTDIHPADVRSGRFIIDGPYVLPVLASIPWKSSCDPATGEGCGSDNFETSFGIPILAPAANYSVTIKRVKKQVVAVYRFEARTALKALIRITLNSFKGGTQILARRSTPQVVEAKPDVIQEVKVVLPWKVIKRKCGTKQAPNCSVLAVGQAWAGNEMVDQGTNARKALKVPHQREKHRKH